MKRREFLTLSIKAAMAAGTPGMKNSAVASATRETKNLPRCRLRESIRVPFVWTPAPATLSPECPMWGPTTSYYQEDRKRCSHRVGQPRLALD